MNKNHNSERDFFKSILIKNIFPELEYAKYIDVTEPTKNIGDGFFKTQVIVTPSIHSPCFFAAKRIVFDRFKINEYRANSTNEFFEVPAEKAQNPQQLVNYMNEVYLHSSNVREIKSGYDLIRGFQISLKLDNLKTFGLSFPAPENVLFIEAVEDSYLFEGSLLIKFV